MNVKTVWAVYFSATGTTRRTVTTIAGQLADLAECPLKEFDFTLPPARTHAMAFAEGDLVVFGTPVYAGRVPNLLIKYIASFQGNGAIGVPIVVYGHRAFDDALIELRNTMEENGFHTVAAAAFIGEHAFSDTLAAARPDARDLAIANEFAGHISDKVESLRDFPAPVVVPGNDPIGPYFQPKHHDGTRIDIRKVKPQTTEDCVKCKLCAKHCPMGAISMDDPTLVPGICIKCNACVKNCPKKAKFFSDPDFLFHRDDIVALYSTPRKRPQLFF
ncbi:MAG: EFR1 family ferrodoxin [Evtepia sp.]